MPPISTEQNKRKFLDQLTKATLEFVRFESDANWIFSRLHAAEKLLERLIRVNKGLGNLDDVVRDAERYFEIN